MLLRARNTEFTFPRPALVMGILNVTPDSFSDGGKFETVEEAVKRGLEMVAQGADLLDVGGESSRPGALPVSEREEMRRVIPVLEALRKSCELPLSIDTTKPSIASAAIEAGASIVNDVAANRTEPEMWKLVARTGAAYVCMHCQGTPQTMQHAPHYEDVLKEVDRFFCQRIQAMSDCGIALEQLILDPGIGFGKTLEHNLALLGGLKRFTGRQRPLMVGISRKSFLARIIGAEIGGKSSASVAAACQAVRDGVQIVRVHDVAETVAAVRTTEAILAHA
jgi:dihydropteroate synthase